jgi:hypothetical protein
VSNLDFSGLTDLAEAGPKSAPKAWTPLIPEVLGFGTVLCFDQSLTATGALILRHTPSEGVVVLRSEKWSTDWEGKEVIISLRRGIDVYRHTKRTIEDARRIGAPFDSVAHESPPNPAAVKGGGYASLLAAQALWCACEEMGIGEPEMLGAQPAKKIICGNGNAKKAEAHKALRNTVLPWVGNSNLVTNEAQRDALMVGLLWLYRRPR